MAAELDVDCLPADDVGGAGHDVGGGDAAGEGHADAGIVRHEGVDGAYARLHRSADFVAVPVRSDLRARIDADVRMRIHQTGNDKFAFEIDGYQLLGRGDFIELGCGSDKLNLSVSHEEDAVFNRRFVLTRVNGGVDERDGRTIVLWQ